MKFDMKHMKEHDMEEDENMGKNPNQVRSVRRIITWNVENNKHMHIWTLSEAQIVPNEEVGTYQTQ